MIDGKSFLLYAVISEYCELVEWLERFRCGGVLCIATLGNGGADVSIIQGIHDRQVEILKVHFSVAEGAAAHTNILIDI